MENQKKSLSKMVKADLIKMVNSLQQKCEKLESIPEEKKSLLEDTRLEVEVLREENKELKEIARKLKGKGSPQENTEKNGRVDADEFKELTAKHRNLEKQYTELLRDYDEIKEMLSENQDNFAELKSRFDRLLEVKKSFSENDQYGHILIDYQYCIRFVNKHAAEILKKENLPEYIDQRIFKLFDYDNGIQIKKQIDRVLLERKHGLLENVYCLLPNRKPLKFNAELHATQFKDKPAVLFTLR